MSTLHARRTSRGELFRFVHITDRVIEFFNYVRLEGRKEKPYFFRLQVLSLFARKIVGEDHRSPLLVPGLISLRREKKMGTSLEIWMERLSKSCTNLSTCYVDWNKSWKSIILVIVTVILFPLWRFFDHAAGSFGFVYWTCFLWIFPRGLSWSWNLLGERSRLQRGSSGTSETCKIGWCSGEVK